MINARMRWCLLMCFIFFCCDISVYTQNNTEEEIASLIQQQIEFILENSDVEEVDALALQSNLYYYYEYPLNLNEASLEELKEFMLLNDLQALHLKKHIAENGPLLSVYELQAIDGFDLNTVRSILPFVHIRDHVNLRSEFQSKLSQEAIITFNRVLEEQIGYTNQLEEERRYLGSPNYYSFRYNVRTRRLSAGIVAEKDAGEEVFGESQKNGFDYYSAHFFAKDLGIMKQLALGDYKLEFGQGLSVWTSRAFNKTADVYTIKRNTKTIAPSRSIDGNFFMRGAAATLGSNKVTATMFASYNTYDATIQNQDSLLSGVDDDILFSSFYSNGYHRTQSELAKKNNVKAVYSGVIPKFQFDRGSISLLAMNRRLLNGTFQPRVYNYNQFAVDSFNNSTQLALSYDYIWKNILLFGEASKNTKGGLGFVQGAMISLDPKLNIILHYRYYPKDFLSMIANPVRESSNYNEEGFYTGFDLKFSPKLTLQGYFDSFANKWLSRSNYRPGKGFEYLFQLNYVKSKQTSFYIRYKEEEKGRNISSETVSQVVPQIRRSFRLNFQHSPVKQWELRTRVELSAFSHEDTSKGVLLFQDFIYKPNLSKFSFTARYALFDTDNYDSRIYAYENDVQYTFLVPAYYYKGSRAYILVNYKFNRNIKLQLKLAQTLYENRNTIGSGLDEISGNAKTTIRALLRVKF